MDKLIGWTVIISLTSFASFVPALWVFGFFD